MTLDHEAVDAALTFLADNWPAQPMDSSCRDGWTGVLVHLRPGELKAALARMPSRFRPDPYALLECVHGIRRARQNAETIAETDRMIAERRAEPRWHGDPRSLPAVAEARRKLGKDRNEDPT